MIDNKTYWIGADFAKDITVKVVKEQPCAVEICAEEMRKQRGLPKDALVPVSIWCDCPKCRTHYC